MRGRSAEMAISLDMAAAPGRDYFAPRSVRLYHIAASDAGGLHWPGKIAYHRKAIIIVPEPAIEGSIWSGFHFGTYY